MIINLVTFPNTESVLKGDSVFAKYNQKSTYVICSTSTPNCRTVSQSTVDAKSRKISYLSCRHTNIIIIIIIIIIFILVRYINRQMNNHRE
jgi:hypothetical protein